MRRKEKEITGISEIESIISRALVCRIALSDNNVPYIVAMNFGYSGEKGRKLYFHCAAEGRKIDMIRKNNYVCFELDTDHHITVETVACDFGMRYSSVVGWGTISFVGSDAEKAEGLNSIMHHYTDRVGFNLDPEIFKRTRVLRLDIAIMTGKKA